MQSNYKRLGDYIREVKVKNTDLKATLLLGINIDKFFMPSVANVIGTDMANYRIVKKSQFACNRMHVGRDYRIPIALSNRDEPFMISPAYDVFEIIDPSFLLPEYLMMWFSRKEFDRNAWFHTDADVRGGLPWKLFCDLKLPIPSPEKQLEIVKEYNVIQNRIKLNNQLIAKLEETAQAIYKQWFVDFEFPDEKGLPYKSNGGKMVQSEFGEIPKGWVVKTVKQFADDMMSGSTPSRDETSYWNSKDIPWLKTGELKNSVILGSEEYISRKGLKESSAKLLPINSVLIAMYGEGITKGQVGYLRIQASTNQACCAIICGDEKRATYVYYYLRINREEIVSVAIGGAQPNLSKNLVEDLILLEPSKDVLSKHPFVEIMRNKEHYTKEIVCLKNSNNLLLAKMTTAGTEIYA